MLCLPGTSLGAGGDRAGAEPDGTSQAVRPASGVLGPGAGYAEEGGSRLVRQLQRRLRRDGYATGPVDGLYGPLTERAVRRFQRASGLAPDGVVGPQTRAAVRAAFARGGSVRPGAGYGTPWGSPRVREIQRRLRSVGYDSGPVDGLFGPRTQAAVQWFQVKHRVRPSGVVAPALLTRLRDLARARPVPGDLAAPHRLSAPPLPWAAWHGRPIRNPHAHGHAVRRAAHSRGPVHPLQLGAGYRTPDGSQRVRRIQRVLRRLGYQSGPVDGLFGPRTRASVQWFQMKHGFYPSGIVEMATLSHLRALAAGNAPAQRAPEHVNTSPAPSRRGPVKTSAGPSRGGQVKTSPAPSRGGPAQPAGKRAKAPAPPARAHQSNQHGSAVTPLLLALVGGLGAAAILLVLIMVRRRRPPESATARHERPGGSPTAPAQGQEPPSADETLRERPQPMPDSAPRPVAAAPAAPEATHESPTAAPPQRKPDRPPLPRVVGYARGDDRVDLEHQAAAIERACRERGWTLARVVRDHGSPDSETVVQPGLAHALAHALEHVQAGSGGRLVVDRLERLGRSVVDLRPLIQWCASNDVDLVALDDSLDASMNEARSTPGVGRAVGNGHNDAAEHGAVRSERLEQTGGRSRSGQ
jgi:peptidoglycan hydrolase-like protein with peptidoglycan-binding domain